MTNVVTAQKRDQLAAREWFGYKPDQNLTEVQKGEVMKMSLFLARHVVGMRSQELYDATIAERNHWQDRAMRAESALMSAHNRIAHVLEFYADPASWNSGDVSEHIYAYDDGGWMARQLCADGWTTKGKSWLVAGAPTELTKIK